MSDEKYVAYVGTYTHENSEGIYVYDIDTKTGELKERSLAYINNPSYVCVSHDGKYLYSIADEGVASFSIDANGDLTKINQCWIGGMRGCYVEVDSLNRFLFVGGYHDGRVTMMRLNKDGSIRGISDGIFHQGLAISATERRLDHPKVSCVQLTPDEKYLCAADYGLNQVKVYKIDYNMGNMKLVDIVRCALDSAPRSIRFSSDGRFMYVLTELANSIEVYKFTDENDDPEFEKVQDVLLCDENTYSFGPASSSMALSVDEKYIYASVDGLNEVVILKRNEKTGKLTIEQSVPVSGDFPKSLAILPDNKHYVVLNHDTDEIRTFESHHDKKYSLMNTAPVTVGKPNCIKLHKLA
ncbi:MAG: beta-propeller fold lactonase family protein [Lachnospiraceae bacterium]|nr:beta-propeller fold lactonase family protein [Lachnospiraceae bacterium]